MTKVGRNTPCPCGSGRKHKACCLGREGAAAPYTQQERVAALQRLTEFVDHASWAPVRERAREEFWEPIDPEDAPMEDPVLQAMSEDLFFFWLMFDRPLDDGRVLAQRFLDTAVDLGEGERRYIERMIETSVRLYEVLQVEPGASLTIRETHAGREVTVQERSGSRSLRRYDLLAARVVPQGASGRPELDGGVAPQARMGREGLLAAIDDRLDGYLRDHPGASETACWKSLAPLLHLSWIAPQFILPLPELRTTDDEELVLMCTYFEVLDHGRAAAALDGIRALKRVAGDATERESAPTKDGPCWSWGRPARSGRPAIALGLVELKGHRLLLRTQSAERAERGRALIERRVGDAVRFVTAMRQHPAQALKEAADSCASPPEPEIPADLQWDLTSEHMARYYRGWLDEPIPALEDHTPREAARSARLRPALIELLKDLVNAYELALTANQPAFDPSWMWAELGLEDAPEAPGRDNHPPPLGHESLERLVPGTIATASAMARSFRERLGEDAGTAIAPELLSRDLGFVRALEAQAENAIGRGADPAAAAVQANLFGSYLWILVNFELHRRKNFWVDEGLAYELAQTKLDLAGEHLRCPFACFAVVFTDRHTLSIAERLLAGDPRCALRGRMLRIVTAYVLERPEAGRRTLEVAFFFDDLGADWPYLLVRCLHFGPEDLLADILTSHPPDVKAEELGEVFSSASLEKLLHSLINAILYATSAGVEPQERRPPRERRIEADTGRARRGPGPAPVFSREEVFYLPGMIEISQMRAMQSLERAPGGGKLMSRFMVRGHWRRPAKSWKEQRPRWIRPYWKGPDMAAMIERAYRLKP